MQPKCQSMIAQLRGPDDVYLRTPIFLTYKLSISFISDTKNIMDFQLRDHLRTSTDIYAVTCDCTHTHNKTRCPFTVSAICEKCSSVNQLVIGYKSLLYHPEIENHKLYVGKEHIHSPQTDPCGVCRGCRIERKCIIQRSFLCNFTTEAITDGCFNTEIANSHLLSEHIFNTRPPMFYICEKHVHVHVNHKYPNVRCIVQTTKCCDSAVWLANYTYSYMITMTHKKLQSHLLYDPSTLRDQSMNHQLSVLRAALINPDAVSERIKHYSKSNFTLSNIDRYKSGKDSVSRIAIHGFDTRGIYQTATISCLLPEGFVLFPQELYDLAQGNYVLRLVAGKRDPSFHIRSMFVVYAIRNPDPTNRTIVIPDVISKPLYQDQDGDKNGFYPIPLQRDGYDCRESFKFKIANFELSEAYHTLITLTGEPRLRLSEYNLQLIHKEADRLMDDEFFRKTYKYGPSFMIAAGCSYLRKEYEVFRDRLIELNRIPTKKHVTIDDVFGHTDLLESIVKSGAKTNIESVNIFLSDLFSRKTLDDRKKDMLDQTNTYLESGRSLSREGRTSFVSLTATNDLMVHMFSIFHNKIFLYSLLNCGLTGVFLWNDATMTLSDQSLEELPLYEDEDAEINDPPLSYYLSRANVE